MSLKTDYKNYVLSESMGGLRRYTMIENSDGTVSFQDASSYEIEGNKFGADDINAIAKAANYSVVETTLESAKWGATAPYTYNLEVSGVTETNINEILPGISIESYQSEALQNANIFDNGQEEGIIKLKAIGDRPNVDIPIRVIVRGDV